MSFLKKLVPPELQFKAVSLKNRFSKFKQTYYSQNGEDIILLSHFPKNYAGFYVDVGAHHPYRISNTYLLHKQGWQGINIDANPETIELFKKVRPNDTNICIGVGKMSGVLKYHRFADPAVNTFSEVEAERWQKKKWNTYLGSIEVPVKPLREIFKEHIDSSQKIDVLSVDVEGLDLEVLESNDWEKYRPKVIVVEDHNFELAKPTQSHIYTFLTNKNYQISDKVKFSLIFSDSSLFSS